MPPILWTGKLSLSMKLIINTSNVLAWITGNTRDTTSHETTCKDGVRRCVYGPCNAI